MGKFFEAKQSDGSKVYAADMSNGRSKMFYDICIMLEQNYLDCPCGVQNDNGYDEYLINPDLFIAFFEKAWKEAWFVEEKGGFLNSWAGYAAGMIENITLEKREWVDRSGRALKVKRYLREDELG